MRTPDPAPILVAETVRSSNAAWVLFSFGTSWSRALAVVGGAVSAPTEICTPLSLSVKPTLLPRVVSAQPSGWVNA